MEAYVIKIGSRYVGYKGFTRKVSRAKLFHNLIDARDFVGGSIFWNEVSRIIPVTLYDVVQRQIVRLKVAPQRKRVMV